MPEPEAFRAKYHEQILAWRAALRGVPSGSVPPVVSGTPTPGTVVQTPADQAAFELRRPREQFLQPLIIGGLLSIYVAMFAIPLLEAGAVFVLGATVMATVTYAVAGRRKKLREAAGRALNSAFNLIGLGRLHDAQEVLRLIEQTTEEAWIHRLVGIQRAIIAIRRGEMAAAETHLTSAIDLPIKGFSSENAAYQLEGAHALRAFVRAALGQHAAARADIEHVKATSGSDDALARVALAEAMILEQQGKREELRLLLTEKSTLLLEHTHPRERAIVRAFQRMVRSDKSSVYRRAETRREKAEGEEPKLADWVAKVAPGAASFVRSARPAEQMATIAPKDVVSRPSEEALRANREAKKPAGSGWLKSPLVGVAVVAAMFAGTWAFFQTPDTTHDVSSVAGTASGVLNTLPLLVLLVPLILGAVRHGGWIRKRRAERAARASTRSSGGATHAPTVDHLRALAESPSPTVAAQAWLLLADQAERGANFGLALEAVTKGLARLSDPRDRAAADIVYPDLLSLRAFALAAHGRFEESNAELASLGPAYPHFSRAVFRARLLMLVRQHNLPGATTWIEQGEADLPLSVREELLADLVRATTQPSLAGAGEIQRLKDELASMPEAKAWIRVAAPGLLDAFEGASEGDPRIRIDAGNERDQLAEEEAAAAQETSALPAPRFAQ